MFATSACFCAARSCGVLQAEVANKMASARHGRTPEGTPEGVDEDRGSDISPPGAVLMRSGAGRLGSG
jgi:hypothetical protein